MARGGARGQNGRRGWEEIRLAHGDGAGLPVEIAAFEEAVQRHVRYSLGKQQSQASAYDVFMAASLAVRDLVIDRMFETEARYQAAGAKRLYYLSMEFLMGRSLGNNLQALGILELCHRALQELGIDVEEVRDAEPDAGLGNGGLGRLAACFLDSLAALGHARLRLRDQLRVRLVPAGDRERLPA